MAITDRDDEFDFVSTLYCVPPGVYIPPVLMYPSLFFSTQHYLMVQAIKHFASDIVAVFARLPA